MGDFQENHSLTWAAVIKLPQDSGVSKNNSRESTLVALHELRQALGVSCGISPGDSQADLGSCH